MNRAAVVFIVVTTLAVAAAFMFNRDLQRERARADALAGRLAELEPIEQSTRSTAPRLPERLHEAEPASDDLALERSEPSPAPSSAEPEPDTPRKPTYRASAQAREQVEQLQAALVHGTPLQDYQVRALIEAIDEVQKEIEQKKHAQDTAAITDWDAERRQRLIETAADVLFESQLEAYIELLNTSR